MIDPGASPTTEQGGPSGLPLPGPPGEMKTRLVKGPHSCPYCGWVFISAARLQEHLPMHNTASMSMQSAERQWPFVCQECGKGFAHKSTLKEHGVVHTQERSHICDQCGKAFKWKNGLKKHMLVHEGGLPFPCHECGKTFAYRY